MSSQSVVPSATNFDFPPHLRIDDDLCPSCEQPIPPEKLAEIKGKIASKERERFLEITGNLDRRHQLERNQAEEAAQQRLDETLLAAENVRKEQAAEWQKTLDEAADAKRAAEEGSAGLRADLAEAARTAAEAIESAKVEAKREANDVAAERLLEVNNARTESEAAFQVKIVEAERVAEEAKATKKDAVDTAVAEKLAEAKEAQTESEAALQAKIVAAEFQKSLAEETLLKTREAISEANAKTAAVEGQLSLLNSEHELTLAARLAAQREIMEKAKDEAVNVERANTFEENQRLSGKVAELTRSLEKKSNEELGEGAELDLFEALKGEFPGDNINRVKKGEPGADIVHVVILQGKDCGTIVYDSKNHKQYRATHVTKLRVDQLAHDADHAILSTHKFPEGARQLHAMEGILLANPARVVQLAALLRRHVVQMHTLRLSNVERESKTEALYTFITSEKCTLMLGSIEGRTDELLTLQEAEIKWHNTNWKRQGEKFRSIQKAKADLDNEISLIVGTSTEDGHQELEEAS